MEKLVLMASRRVSIPQLSAAGIYHRTEIKVTYPRSWSLAKLVLMASRRVSAAFRGRFLLLNRNKGHLPKVVIIGKASLDGLQKSFHSFPRQVFTTEQN